MIIAVDIDGTLTNETEGHDYANRTPNMVMIKFVQEAYEALHSIILWSSRYEVDRAVTIDWLLKYNIPYSKLILDKLTYDLLIDDKTIPVEQLKTHMENLKSKEHSNANQEQANNGSGDTRI